MVTAIYNLLSCLWKVAIIQENIFRNRKQGEDPNSSKWHWWQGAQCAAVLCMVAWLRWRLLFWEFPLTVLFGIVFNGLGNLYTFKNDHRAFWYVPPIRYGLGDTPVYAGSAMDRWLQKKSNPVLWLKIIQLSALLFSLVVFVIAWQKDLL